MLRIQKMQMDQVSGEKERQTGRASVPYTLLMHGVGREFSILIEERRSSGTRGSVRLEGKEAVHLVRRGEAVDAEAADAWGTGGREEVRWWAVERSLVLWQQARVRSQYEAR